MPGHLSEQELDSYNRRLLPVDQMLAADEHLAACQSCYERFGGPEKLEELYSFARTDLDRAEGHQPECVPIEMLGQFVNREPLRIEDRDWIEHHLASCEDCAQLVGDLRGIRSDIDWDNPIEPRKDAAVTAPSKFWTPARVMGAAAAAALLIAALTTVAVFQREFRQLRERISELQQGGERLEREAAASRDLGNEVAELRLEIERLRGGGTPPREEVLLTDGGRRITLDSRGNLAGLDSVPANYVSLVREALIDERVRIVDARFPGQTAAHVRGSGDVESFRLSSPVGAAVLSERPVFKWEPLPGAERYVVFVRDLTSDVEIESKAITATEWTPDSPLVRGHTYGWAVEAVKDGRRIHAPSAQAADARFKILDKAKVDELSRAKSASGGSHLVMGIVYARHGLVAEAEAELEVLRTENPKSQVVGRMVKSLRLQRRAR